MEELNKKEKITKKDLFLIVIIILFLSGATYWNFKNWRKSLTEVELPKFEMPKFEPFPKKEGYEEFVSPDGKLKLKYPADWLKMDIEVLESYTQREIEGKPLFFAQKFKMEIGSFSQAFLTIQELTTNKENLEEILDEMKKKTEEKEGKMEISKLEIKDKEAVFEAKYSKKEGPVFQSKEKMILNEKKYLISVFAFEKDFPGFEKEAEEIINSTQLVE